MRKLVVTLAVSAAATVSVASGDNAVGIQSPVRLDTPAELARLRATNPDHYARAEHLIAEANFLCPPATPKLQDAELHRSDAACGLLLWTSNPPKREITFRLDGIRYAARVAITADPPRPVHAFEPSKAR